MKNFSDRLAYAIRHSGVSKGALAKHLGIPQSSVSRWLAGSAPRAETLGGIAKFLSVDVNWLMTGLGTEPLPAVLPAPVKHVASVLREEPVGYHFKGERSIMDRLMTLEEKQDEMQRTIDELKEMIQGKEQK